MSEHDDDEVMRAIEAARCRLGYPSTVELSPETAVDVLLQAVDNYRDRPAFSCMGQTLTFAQVERLSQQFAAFLQQHTDLEPGDRIAIQLPNVLQYPVVVYGALRAGLVVVNTNPLYTAREMQHQFVDAGAKAIVILSSMAHKLQEILPATGLRHVIVTDMADLHRWPGRWIINAAARYVKKIVPDFYLPRAVTLRWALARGAESRFVPVQVHAEDLAVLQYTGGTTGVAKGAMLTHRNLLANMRQCTFFLQKAGVQCGGETVVAPLPIYHIYAFMLHCLLVPHCGNHSLLITNPRDTRSVVRALASTPWSVFVGINTLFVSLMNDSAFRRLDFSALKLTLSGGMALTESAARDWESLTGCTIVEGYGLTESSPVLTINPPDHVRPGSIGIPLASTAIRIVGEQGEVMGCGQAGELCAQGPQVMRGYWQRPEATRETVIDGWLHTGDIAVVDEDGYLRIVDRKKDMIIVSGFNVYPNEIENVMSAHPEIVECAAVGVPDALSGEAVKLYVVPRTLTLDEAQVKAYAREQLTAYKIPRHVEFRDSLPKSNVGKILRRELRETCP